MTLKDYIRHVPDFPKPGILFYDISPLLADGKAWREAVHRLRDAILPFKPDGLIGIESRGFLVVAPLALELGLGFVMIRKKGKLPGATVRYSYGLEYGEDTLEIQDGAIRPGQRLVLLDDLLATGGTMAAAVELIGKVGGTVAGSACLIELRALNGRQRLEKLGIPCHCLMTYDL